MTPIDLSENYAPPFKQEDLLAYLPRTEAIAFRSGQTIYDSTATSNGLYMVERGKVIVSRVENGALTISRLCFHEDFFGELALAALGGERAEALEEASVMCWPVEVLRGLIASDPVCGIGLVQELARRSSDIGARMVHLANYSIRKRLALSLLSFVEEEGMSMGGYGKIECLPHRLLAQYIGTSREIITHSLNHFRRLNIITYSRKLMDVDVPALRRFVDSEETENASVNGRHDKEMAASATA